MRLEIPYNLVCHHHQDLRVALSRLIGIRNPVTDGMIMQWNGNINFYVGPNICNIIKVIRAIMVHWRRLDQCSE